MISQMPGVVSWDAPTSDKSVLNCRLAVWAPMSAARSCAENPFAEKCSRASSPVTLACGNWPSGAGTSVSSRPM
jgi:hypothetical protein